MPDLDDRPCVGAHSRPLRFLIATLVVGAYMALGFRLHLDRDAYQLLGIAMLLIFQLAIQRQPILALWVRSAPPLRLDSAFFVRWSLFSLLPLLEGVRSLANGDVARTGIYAAAIPGAFGLAYALQRMQAENVRQLGLCLLTAGGIGLLPLLLSRILPRILHIHMKLGPSNPMQQPALLPSLLTGGETLLIGLPLGFMVEEVFFRGALDTYLHRGEKTTGWFSAIYVSALWGVWHLPGQTIPPGRLLPTILGLIVAQVAVGVPLSLWWRRSGNLTVPDATHAVLDAVRAALG